VRGGEGFWFSVEYIRLLIFGQRLSLTALYSGITTFCEEKHHHMGG